jgi:hypothetical protein
MVLSIAPSGLPLVKRGQQRRGDGGEHREHDRGETVAGGTSATAASAASAASSRRNFRPRLAARIARRES